jgi:hypothetical protein
MDELWMSCWTVKQSRMGKILEPCTNATLSVFCTALVEAFQAFVVNSLKDSPKMCLTPQEDSC